MVNYAEAIKKPFSNLKTLGIGAVISAVPLVNLLTNGYALKTAEDVIGKKNKLRDWKLDDIGEYVIKAVLLIVLSLAYLIIPLIIIGIGFGAAVLNMLPAIINGTGDVNSVMNTLIPSLMVGGPIILIGLLLAIIAVFLLPMATMKWLKKKEFSAALNIGSVVKNALTLDYILSLIVIFVYAVILAFVAGILNVALAMIPVIGVLLGLIVTGGITFAISVTEYTILAQVVKD